MKIVRVILTFEQAKGEGQSVCQRCKTVCWDSMMYKVKEFGDRRVCGDCYRKFISEGEVIL